MTVHRFIQAHPHGKHADKTACGIILFGALPEIGTAEAATSRGSHIEISARGKPFNCPRCRNRLELLHGRN